MSMPPQNKLHKTDKDGYCTYTLYNNNQKYLYNKIYTYTAAACCIKVKVIFTTIRDQYHIESICTFYKVQYQFKRNIFKRYRYFLFSFSA